MDNNNDNNDWICFLINDTEEYYIKKDKLQKYPNCILYKIVFGIMKNGKDEKERWVLYLDWKGFHHIVYFIENETINYTLSNKTLNDLKNVAIYLCFDELLEYINSYIIKNTEPIVISSSISQDALVLIYKLKDKKLLCTTFKEKYKENLYTCNFQLLESNVKLNYTIIGNTKQELITGILKMVKILLSNEINEDETFTKRFDIWFNKK